MQVCLFLKNIWFRIQEFHYIFCCVWSGLDSLVDQNSKGAYDENKADRYADGELLRAPLDSSEAQRELHVVRVILRLDPRCTSCSYIGLVLDHSCFDGSLGVLSVL